MESDRSGVHPVLIIGVIIFVLPVITNIFHFQLPSFITKVGIIFIVAGIILSLYYSLKAR